MKKIRLAVLGAILTFSLGSTVYGEITVPKDVETMVPVEAYKKGFEDGVKSVTTSSNTVSSGSEDVIEVRKVKEDLDNSAIGKALVTDEAEIRIISVKKEKYEDKYIAKVEYSVKNLTDSPTTASMLVYMNAYQNGVECDPFYGTPEMDNSMKNIKKGVTIDKCFYAFEIDPETETVELEVGDFSNKVNIIADIK